MFPLHKETEYERQYSASTPSSRHQSFSHDNVGPSISRIPSIHRIARIAHRARLTGCQDTEAVLQGGYTTPGRQSLVREATPEQGPGEHGRRVSLREEQR